MDNLSQSTQGNVEQAPFGAIHHNLSDIMPTSSEIGNLWESYYAECMSVAFLKNYVEHSKDTDIKPVLQQALDISTQRVQTMETLFNSINHPIPEAFGDKDVNAKAKPLFSEPFRLLYTRLMHKYILINYTKALTSSYRSDFRNFFSSCIKTSDEIFQRATDVLLGKGILMKSPNILIPDRVDYVHNKSYFGKFFGEQKRPLNALEIGEIYSIIEIQYLTRTLKLGYSQVVKSEKIKNYLSSSKEKTDKNLEKLTLFLEKENIVVPMISDIFVTDSEESPLSDRLILSHSTAVAAFAITEIGLAMPDISRKDLVLTMRNLVTDILLIAKEGAELMIEAGWLEKIPETVDREELLH
ncbi:DUF3231 family protein [Desulfosporosinus sp. SB140]|uniref:DUF3231 family protein n=1 Tax=Desulfosporosinus paludis TaxID=3115649 RepID=UPI00388E3881